MTQRIYVTCENQATWIDCNKDLDDIEAEIFDMLKYADNKEYKIVDSEGFYGIDIKDKSIEEIHEITEMLNNCTVPEDVVAEIYNSYGGDCDDVIEQINDTFAGCDVDVESWLQNFLDETGSLENVPADIRNYIDFESKARDMEASGHIETIYSKDNQVYVFWC